MMGRSASTRNGIAAFAAIFGVLLQLFVFAVHGPANSRAAQTSTQAVEPIVICTAHGTATIALDSEGNPIELPPPIHVRAGCDLCLGMSGLVLAPPADAFVLAAGPALTAPSPKSQTAITTRSQRAYRSRGPPSQSIA